MTQPRIPWTRLGAEFVMIVVGVLLALSADAWLTDRQDRSAETEILASLRDELLANQDRLETSRRFSNAMEAAAYRVLEIAAYPEPPVSADSLDNLLGKLTWYQGSNWVTATVDAVVSSGDLALIQDRSIRTALSAWVRQVEVVTSAEALEKENLEGRLMSFLAREAYIAQFSNTQAIRPGETDLMISTRVVQPIERDSLLEPWEVPLAMQVDNSELLRDREFLNLALYRFWDFQNLRVGYDNLEADLEDLLQQIEAELAR